MLKPFPAGSTRGVEIEQHQLQQEISSLRTELVRQMEKAVAASQEAEDLALRLHRAEKETRLQEYARTLAFPFYSTI